MSIRVLVVDDDPIGLRVTKNLISYHPSLTWIGEANSALMGERKIRAEKPDAIFLDIHMPQASGFDLLRNLEVHPKVIFVTSFPMYALGAFEVDAVDYLLKPVSRERFSSAVEKLERLFQPSQEPRPAEDRILLRTPERTYVVSTQRIVAIRAEGDFSHVFIEGEAPVMINRPLGHFCETLSDPPFVRADRSLIVNTERIHCVERISRNETRLSMLGLAHPFDLGRTATERLRGIISSPQLRPQS